MKIQVACLAHILTLISIAAAQTTQSCACYTVDSLLPPNLSSFLPSQQTYSVRSFSEFRSLPSPGTPAPVSNSQPNGTEPITNAYFSRPPFSSTWAIQNWSQPAIADKDVYVRTVNSAQNVFARSDSSSSTYLRLRTTRVESFSSIAEIDTLDTSIRTGTFRVMARVSGAGGACAGLFTYYNDTNESDIEILTRDPSTQFRATNQPDVDDQGNLIPGASTIEPLSNNSASWTDWHIYRLDWFPTATIWIVDGAVVASKTLNVPREPSSFNINMWSNGGSWTGNMTIGQEAYLDITWVELVYNTGDGTPGSCSSTCSLDEVDASLGLNSTMGNGTGTGATSGASTLDSVGWRIMGSLVGLLILVRVLQMWIESEY